MTPLQDCKGPKHDPVELRLSPRFTQQNTLGVVEGVSRSSVSPKKVVPSPLFLLGAADVRSSLSAVAEALRKAFFLAEFMANGSSVSVRVASQPCYYPHHGAHAARTFIIFILKPLSGRALQEMENSYHFMSRFIICSLRFFFLASKALFCFSNGLMMTYLLPIITSPILFMLTSAVTP